MSPAVSAVRMLAIAASLAAVSARAAETDSVAMAPVHLRLQGGAMVHAGAGIADGHAGESREVRSDLGYGLRASAGFAWTHFVASLDGELMRRDVVADETPTVAMPVPSTRNELEFLYLTIRPEIGWKTRLGSPDLEVGAYAGLGSRILLQGRSSLDESHTWNGQGALRTFLVAGAASWRGFTVRTSIAATLQPGSAPYYGEMVGSTFCVGYTRDFALPAERRSGTSSRTAPAILPSTSGQPSPSTTTTGSES